MVQALVQINENTNRVLNNVKVKYGLKDKGEAIQFVVTEYIEKEGDPELRPEFLERLNKIRKGKYRKFKSIEELRKLTN